MWFWHLFKSDLIPEYVRLYIEHSIKITGDLNPDMYVLITFMKSGALSLDLRKGFCQYISNLKTTNRHVDCVSKEYLDCMCITYSLLEFFSYSLDPFFNDMCINEFKSQVKHR